MTRPLTGYRVLDLTRILAGPFCTMLLGDMGAEVIKIEHVKGGDDTRTWGPPFSREGHESAYFLGVNRNKKSVAVDLKHPQGVKIVKQLAAKSDVVVENFVPGRLDKMGLGFTDLAAVNDQLVYATISGFGTSGPRAAMPAYDVMISALGGLMGITGPAGGPPCKVGVAITDVCAGLVMQGAILGALLARHRTGKGQRIETSLLDTQVAALANIASNFLVAGAVTGPQGTAHTSIVPYQDFRCADQSVVVGALNDSQFRNLAKCIGRSELADDSKFATNPQRVANRLELVSILEIAFAQGTACSWIEKLEAAGVPCAPINRVDQVFEDKQVVHNKRVLSVEHPTVGMLKMVAPPATFYGTPLTTFAPPPLHGEHTDAVLSEVLGYSSEQLAALKSQFVLHQHTGA